MIIGVWDQFRSGAEVSCPEYFLHCMPEIKWFCANFTCFFARKWIFEKFWTGGGGGVAAAPLAPRPVGLYGNDRYIVIDIL